MSILQYIGARYVPKFYEGVNGAEWVSGVAYEALTIVTYSGNSFTSKKPVPANIGNPADNGEYWVSTGVYNEQLESLIEAVSGFESDLETAITVTVPQMILNSKNKSIICIGDSYNQAWDPDNSDYIKGWGARVIDCYDLTENTNAWNLKEGGIGFYRTGPLGHNAKSLLQTIESTLTDEQKNLVTDICCYMGYNDQTESWANIHSGTIDFIRYCNSIYPYAKIHIGVVAWNVDPSDSASTIRANLLKVLDAVYKAHEDSGLKTAYATYINAFYALHRSNGMFSDGIHPNDGGQNAICQSVCSAIEGGDGAVPYQMITSAVTGDTSGSLSLNCFAGGDSTLTVYVQGTVGLPTGSDTPIIGSMPSNSLISRGAYSGAFLIDAFVKRTETDNALIPARVLLAINSSGKLTCKPFLTNAAGTGWNSDYTELYVPGQYITLSRYVY